MQEFRIPVIWILCKYLGFRIPILSWIPGFLELYSAFHEPNFPGLRNLESLTRGDQMIRPWLRRAKGYPHPQRLPGAKTCYPRCKKNYTLSNNKKSPNENCTDLLCIFPTSWLATGGEPDRRKGKKSWLTGPCQIVMGSFILKQQKQSISPQRMVVEITNKKVKPRVCPLASHLSAEKSPGQLEQWWVCYDPLKPLY